MNHTRTAVALAAAGLLLAGCSSGPDEDSDAARKKAAQEAVYALQAGKGDPDDFKASAPASSPPKAKIRLGFSDKATGALIGAAPALCPQHQAKIDAWTAALN